eukprot:3939859-Rhodomonas_salina.1
MYQVGKEYRSSARLNLLMLFWDIFEFWRGKSEVDSRTNHLRQGFSGWLDDLRFKYKSFQTRDLPPVDKKDVQIELARRIDELEAKELGSASKNVSHSTFIHLCGVRMLEDAVPDLTDGSLPLFRPPTHVLCPSRVRSRPLFLQPAAGWNPWARVDEAASGMAQGCNSTGDPPVPPQGARHPVTISLPSFLARFVFKFS